MVESRDSIGTLGGQALEELNTARDFIRWGASRFNQAGLFFGHGTEDAIDEAIVLVLHGLHLPQGLADEFLRARLTRDEKIAVLELLQRRIRERVPAAYLTHEAWFAGLSFYVDERVLVPRSPIAELIGGGFQPWMGEKEVTRILDLCTGSGCIAIACAMAFPWAHVDAGDISTAALEVAGINIRRHGLEARVRPVHSDLFADLMEEPYDLIVCNPPYVDAVELAAMPGEFHREPRVGLAAGEDGLDVVRRILPDIQDHLAEDGLLVVEVGASRPAMEVAFPQYQFLWPELEHGGEGVFILEAGQINNLLD
ncbi:MAG: 50S ribosomal protein L3 N(5)-glutamine methyltransferase [Gammaproteobacteria bacterium]|nr:50S ribosomal protein L3 N(5)-glutamine methyltransferase [Gammaproteobacteria bacterium]